MTAIDPRLLHWQTARLDLRMPEASDAPAWVRWTGDAETMRFMGAPLGPEDAWRNLAMMVGHWHLRGFGMWTMVERATGRRLGRGGLWQPEGWPGLEIGWLVDRDFRGQGYAIEMAQAAAQAAFEVFDASEVISLILEDNVKSIRVAERLGSTRHRLETVRGFVCWSYRLCKADWRPLKPQE